MNKDKPLRDFLGNRVFQVYGNTAGSYHVREYEVIEAPGDHNYEKESSVWFLGKRVGLEKGIRPEYVTIPWKDLRYLGYEGSFYPTPEEAIVEMEKIIEKRLEALKNLRASLSTEA